MTQIYNLTGTLCPKCKRGGLVKVGRNAWHCDRRDCDTECFLDNSLGVKLIACRQKRMPAKLLYDPEMHYQIYHAVRQYPKAVLVTSIAAFNIGVVVASWLWWLAS